MKLPGAIRKWEILGEDFDGETISLTEDVPFVGTSREADQRAKKLSDAYEAEHGFLSTLIIESMGIMWQGPSERGGLNPVGRPALSREQRQELEGLRICNQALILSQRFLA